MRTAGARGLVMLSLMLALPAFTQAQSPAEVPVGTKVALRFLTGLDSTTAVQDQRIDFRVAAPVTVHRRIVLREGVAAHGFVVSVIRETRSGVDGRIRIAFVETTAVDGHLIRLGRIDVTPASFRRVEDPVAFIATSKEGAILLGSDGATGVGAPVRGRRVAVPAGAVVVTSTTHRVQVNTR